MNNTFRTTFATGSIKARTFGFIAQLCEFCHSTDKGASRSTFQGKHWRVLATSKKFESDEEAQRAAKNLRRSK